MSERFKDKVVPLTGKLNTHEDATTIGGDFKQLVNLRYGDQNPIGVLGHSKVNANALETGGVSADIRQAFHLRKEQPAESHVLVQARDGSGLNPKVYRNDTAIPSTGDFTGTALFTEDTAAGTGRFADAPDGAVVYCNGKETCLWGGDEFRVASFIRYDPDDNTKKWDYTEQVSNTLTTEYATLDGTGTDIDSYDKILLHCDGSDGGTTFTDTIGTHTVTAQGNANTDTGQKKFGTASGQFDGTGDYLTIPDHADFDLSGGTWTIDFWIRPTGASGTTDTIYWQGLIATPDDDYMRIYYYNAGFGAIGIGIIIASTAGGSIVSTATVGDIVVSSWNHVAVVESGDNYYIFVNGQLGASLAGESDRAANYDTTAYIGSDGGTTPAHFTGWIDEFRISNGVARWTSAFTPPEQAYPIESCELYIGSIMPIQGITFDVVTGYENASACVPTITYFDGVGWTSVGTVTDNTDIADSGIALEQSGSMTFTSTASVAKARVIDRIYLYWYRLSLPGIDDDTKVNYVTVDIPFQTFKDIWDGELRSVTACLQWDDNLQRYYDHTVAVFEDYYASEDSGTFAAIADTASPDIDLTTGVDYILISSIDRLAGFSFNIVGGKENSTVTATMSVSYWEGDDWVSVGTVTDGTIEDGKTLAKSGFATWSPPVYGTEFKRQDLSVRRTPPGQKSTSTITDEGERRTIEYTDPGGEAIGRKQWKKLNESVKKHPLAMAQFEYATYWYKIEFNDTLEDDLFIYHIGCVPAQTEIGGYKFPVIHNESVWLMSEPAQHKNQIIKLSPGTVNVANGDGSDETKIGNEEEVVGGGSIKAAVGDKLLSTLIVFKKHQTWAIYGSGELSQPIPISWKNGCIAPGTIKNVTITTESGEVDILIFQSHNGMYGTNGTSVFPLDRDTRNVFDQNDSNSILTSRVAVSEAFYDNDKREYHWLWTASGTTHNRESVFDCERLKWTTIDRATGAYLQCGTDVYSTEGDTYNYGCSADGFMYRLENGLTFVTASGTNDIVYTFETGDFALDGIAHVTTLRNVSLHSVGKTTTTNTVAITHYGDTSDTGTDIPALDAGDAGERVQIVNRQTNKQSYVYHRLKFVITNSDDTVGFEPLYLAMLYDQARQNTRSE